MRLRSFFRLGIIGAATTTLLAIKANDWNLTSIGLIRFGRAAITVTNIALDYKLSLKDLETESTEYEKTKSEVHTRSAQKLLELCRVNGGAFIKVGQHIGTMDYLLPDEYVDTMKILHSSAPKSSINEVLSVIREELNEEPEEIFQCFNTEPIGAASLAQVHKARLKCGTLVAVKVQHPYVLRHSYVDMKTMELLVKIVAKIFPEFKFNWLAEEMKTNLPKELDFLNEGKNAERIAKNYSHYPWLKIPEIYWSLSTKRVLTMEYCKGGQINDRNYIITNNIDAVAVSELLGKLYSEMIFIQGDVHCDPHPGNLFVSSVDDEPVITLLDHGLYRTLSYEFRILYCKLWLALLNADEYKIKKYSAALGVGELYGVLASMVTARSWESVREGITNVELTSAENVHIKTNASRYLPEITEVLERTPREMILILKTNDLLRSIERSLTQKQATVSFKTMSRYCLQSVFQHKLNECNTCLCKWKEGLYYYWIQFKLFLRSFLVQVQSSRKGCAGLHGCCCYTAQIVPKCAIC